MRPIFDGFVTHLRTTLGTARYLGLLALMLASSWCVMDIYRQQSLERLPVVVMDQDHSTLSRTLRTYLAASKDLRIVDDGYTLDSARHALVKGTICALIVLPEGLSRRVKDGSRGEVLFFGDMSNMLTGRTAYKAVFKVVGTVSAGVEIKYFQKLGVADSALMGAVLPISLDDQPTFNPTASYASYLAPGIVFFLLHIYILIMGLAVVHPEAGFTTRRLRLGAFAAVVAVGTILGLLFFYVLLPQANLHVASEFSVVFAMLLTFVVWEMLLIITIDAMFPQPVLTLEATVFVGMLSLMLAGVTFPTDLFPTPVRLFSYLLPFTPFAKGLRQFINYPMTLGQLSAHYELFLLQLVVCVALLVVFRVLWRSAARLQGRTP